ncbi:DUF1016 N-terminal domain-containing protein [uncultured Mucilaginibacter sp.]|uniref:DUF1016 N-terminal domain-containing protein n=1 Tax=uncultured Mucilaginibacter sp. TaxID=797541 RepID=UPI0025FC123E|nr:DUF1016 N-terminal domain-containing protein [uncultured Mucilaginibacter sp.]
MSIENDLDSITQMLNSSLLFSFKTIGTWYNEHCSREALYLQDNLILNDLAEQLEPKYGPYFSKENLLRMSAFAKRMSANPKLFDLHYFVTWEHIVLLLPFDDDALWLFYVRLTQKHRLTVEELASAIKSKQYENDENFWGKKNLKLALQKSLSHGSPEEKFLPLWMMKYQRDWKPLFLPFKNPLLSFFEPLLRIEEYPVINLDNYHDEDLLIRITHDIDSLKIRLNRSLNEKLNLLFWETGRKLTPASLSEIDRAASFEKTDERLIVVKEVTVIDTTGHTHDFSTTVTQQVYDEEQQQRVTKYQSLFTNLFNQQEFQHMQLFGSKFSNIKLIVGFCHLVTWDQIKELIRLDTEDDMIELAFEVAQGKIGHSDLKRLVDERQKNSTFKINSKSKHKYKTNSFFNAKTQVSVFQNEYFMQFVAVM